MLNRHTPIHRGQFQKHIYDLFYPHGVPKRHVERAECHRLGVLFITLALGVLADARKPMLSVEAETYYQLARAAYVQKVFTLVFPSRSFVTLLSLSMDPVCDNPTIYALQCMVCKLFSVIMRFLIRLCTFLQMLLHRYMRMAPSRTTAGNIWAFTGVIMKYGRSITI